MTDPMSALNASMNDVSINEENVEVEIISKTVDAQDDIYLDGMTFIEYIPLDRLNSLLQSTYLVEKWDDKIYSQRNAKYYYENEKQQLLAYKKTFDKNLNGFKVTYHKGSKHKWGRVYPSKSLGLTTFRRQIRNTLVKDLYYDIDLSTAQQQILRNICKDNNIPCPAITHYCANRSQILNEVMATYSVEKWVAKQLFIRLMFYGSFHSWIVDNNISNTLPTEFIDNFINELHNICEILWKCNEAIANTSKQLGEEKKKELSPDKANRKSKYINTKGSFFSLYLQEYEYRIVSKVIEWLKTKTSVMKHPTMKTDYSVGTYEYDGMKLLKSNVDAYGLEKLLEDLNAKTLELTSFELNWEVKEIDEVYDLSSMEKLPDSYIAEINEMNECIAMMKSNLDSDTKICDFIKKELKPNHFMYLLESDEKGMWYGWNGSRWVKNATPLRDCIQYEIYNYYKQKLSYYQSIIPSSDALNEEIINKAFIALEDVRTKVLQKNGAINAIVSLATSNLQKTNEEVKFDMNTNLLGMKNGVYDFSEKVFRPYRFNDYVTFSVGYDFTPTHPLNYIALEKVEGKDELQEVLKQPEEMIDGSDEWNFNQDILNLLVQLFPDEDVRKLILDIVSSGLLGHIEKFFIFNGSGGNGKGVLNEFVSSTLGDYYLDASNKLIIENIAEQDSSKPNPALCQLDKKRYVVMKELPAKALLQNSLIKHLTGGGTISARDLYSKQKPINLFMTLVCEVNEKPPFAEEPTGADIRRYTDILFGSKFVNDEALVDETKHIYLANLSIKETEWKTKRRNAFLNILIDRANQLRDNNYDIVEPQSVKDRTASYMNSQFPIYAIFLELFEERNPDNAKMYRGIDGKENDTDWSLASVVKVIKASNKFTQELPKNVKKSYEKSSAIKDFFNKFAPLKKLMYSDSKNQHYIKGWRKIIPDDE